MKDSNILEQESRILKEFTVHFQTLQLLTAWADREKKGGNEKQKWLRLC